MRAKLPPRVLGPYQDRGKWRLIIVENGQKENQIYATKEEALRMQRKLAKDIVPQTRTVEIAITAWKEDRRQTGTCKELTLDQQATRVRFMLCEHLQEDLTRITGLDARQIADLMALLAKNGPLNPSASVSQPVLGNPSATGGYRDDHVGGKRVRVEPFGLGI
jgi:hypothetical protein